MYEGEIGEEIHRCAIGCLVSPGALSEVVVIDGSGPLPLRRYRGSVMGMRQRYPTAAYELSGVNEGFLDRAQTIHDRPESWKDGKFRVSVLDGLAAQYGLTVVVDEPQIEKQGAPREGVLIA